MLLAASPLIDVVPGLMIWTLVCFAITFFVLRKYAFGPIQKMIDERRDRIRSSIEEAEHARDEARRLLEEHKQLIGQAKSEAGRSSPRPGRSPTRSVSVPRRRPRPTASAGSRRRASRSRPRRVRALEQIRAEVAELALAATAKVTGKVLDRDDHRKLIEDAIGDLDFSALEANALVAVAAPPVRPVALRGSEGGGPARARPRRARRLRRGARGGARAAQPARRIPSSTRTSGRQRSTRSSATPTS